MPQENEIKEVVEMAVEMERMGCAFYETMAARFAKNAEIGELFTALANDERVHEKMFRELLAKMPGIANPRTKDDSIAFLRIMVLPETMLTEQDAQARLHQIQTPRDAVDRALRVEKDTFAYYEAMKDIFGKHEALEKIIEEEKRHIIKLTEYLITGAKMRGLEDKFSG
jgi:rubrerythrin